MAKAESGEMSTWMLIWVVAFSVIGGIGLPSWFLYIKWIETSPEGIMVLLYIIAYLVAVCVCVVVSIFLASIIPSLFMYKSDKKAKRIKAVKDLAIRSAAAFECIRAVDLLSTRMDEMEMAFGPNDPAVMRVKLAHKALTTAADQLSQASSAEMRLVKEAQELVADGSYLKEIRQFAIDEGKRILEKRNASGDFDSIGMTIPSIMKVVRDAINDELGEL